MVFRQFHYTKRDRFMPFLLAEILNFQGSTHRIGVGSFSYLYCQVFPDAYNRVHRNVPEGTADSPCKLLCMCCLTSLSPLLRKLAPLAPHFKCLHKCCTCPVSFQQGIFGALMLITRGCMVWWSGIQPLAFLPSKRKEVLP